MEESRIDSSTLKEISLRITTSTQCMPTDPTTGLPYTPKELRFDPNLPARKISSIPIASQIIVGIIGLYFENKLSNTETAEFIYSLNKVINTPIVTCLSMYFTPLQIQKLINLYIKIEAERTKPSKNNAQESDTFMRMDTVFTEMTKAPFMFGEHQLAIKSWIYESFSNRFELENNKSNKSNLLFNAVLTQYTTKNPKQDAKKNTIPDILITPIKKFILDVLDARKIPIIVWHMLSQIYISLKENNRLDESAMHVACSSYFVLRIINGYLNEIMQVEKDNLSKFLSKKQMRSDKKQEIINIYVSIIQTIQGLFNKIFLLIKSKDYTDKVITSIKELLGEDANAEEFVVGRCDVAISKISTAIKNYQPLQEAKLFPNSCLDEPLAGLNTKGIKSHKESLNMYIDIAKEIIKNSKFIHLYLPESYENAGSIRENVSVHTTCQLIALGLADKIEIQGIKLSELQMLNKFLDSTKADLPIQHVKITIQDNSDHPIEDSHFASFILAMLNKCKSIKFISLKNCNMGEKSIDALIKLAKNNLLTHLRLDLSGNILGTKAILKLLQEILPRIHKLKLLGCVKQQDKIADIEEYLERTPVNQTNLASLKVSYQQQFAFKSPSSRSLWSAAQASTNKFYVYEYTTGPQNKLLGFLNAIDNWVTPAVIDCRRIMQVTTNDLNKKSKEKHLTDVDYILLYNHDKGFTNRYIAALSKNNEKKLFLLIYLAITNNYQSHNHAPVFLLQIVHSLINYQALLKGSPSFTEIERHMVCSAIENMPVESLDNFHQLWTEHNFENQFLDNFFIYLFKNKTDELLMLLKPDMSKDKEKISGFTVSDIDNAYKKAQYQKTNLELLDKLLDHFISENSSEYYVRFILELLELNSVDISLAKLWEPLENRRRAIHQLDENFAEFLLDSLNAGTINNTLGNHLIKYIPSIPDSPRSPGSPRSPRSQNTKSDSSKPINFVAGLIKDIILNKNDAILNQKVLVEELNNEFKKFTEKTQTDIKITKFVKAWRLTEQTKAKSAHMAMSDLVTKLLKQIQSNENLIDILVKARLIEFVLNNFDAQIEADLNIDKQTEFNAALITGQQLINDILFYSNGNIFAPLIETLRALLHCQKNTQFNLSFFSNFSALIQCATEFKRAPNVSDFESSDLEYLNEVMNLIAKIQDEKLAQIIFASLTEEVKLKMLLSVPQNTLVELIKGSHSLWLQVLIEMKAFFECKCEEERQRAVRYLSKPINITPDVENENQSIIILCLEHNPQSLLAIREVFSNFILLEALRKVKLTAEHFNTVVLSQQYEVLSILCAALPNLPRLDDANSSSPLNTAMSIADLRALQLMFNHLAEHPATKPNLLLTHDNNEFLPITWCAHHGFIELWKRTVKVYGYCLSLIQPEAKQKLTEEIKKLPKEKQTEFNRAMLTESYFTDIVAFLAAANNPSFTDYFINHLLHNFLNHLIHNFINKGKADTNMLPPNDKTYRTLVQRLELVCADEKKEDLRTCLETSFLNINNILTDVSFTNRYGNSAPIIAIREAIAPLLNLQQLFSSIDENPTAKVRLLLIPDRNGFLPIIWAAHYGIMDLCKRTVKTYGYHLSLIDPISKDKLITKTSKLPIEKQIEFNKILLEECYFTDIVVFLTFNNNQGLIDHFTKLIKDYRSDGKIDITDLPDNNIYKELVKRLELFSASEHKNDFRTCLESAFENISKMLADPRFIAPAGLIIALNEAINPAEKSTILSKLASVELELDDSGISLEDDLDPVNINFEFNHV